MWSDNETAIDLLGFKHLANAVVSIILNDQAAPGDNLELLLNFSA